MPRVALWMLSILLVNCGSDRVLIGGPPVCGNGIIESGEVCDGDCPTRCDDANACTTDLLIGDAPSCTAECYHQPITECIHDDGCCPVGQCDWTHDNDCVEPPPPDTCPAGWTCEALGDATVCEVEATDADTWQITVAGTNEERGMCLVYKESSGDEDLHLEFQLSDTVVGNQGDYAGCGVVLRNAAAADSAGWWTWWPLIGRTIVKVYDGANRTYSARGAPDQTLPVHLLGQYDASAGAWEGAESTDGVDWFPVGAAQPTTALSGPVVYGFFCNGRNGGPLTAFILDRIVADERLETIDDPPYDETIHTIDFEGTDFLEGFTYTKPGDLARLSAIHDAARGGKVLQVTVAEGTHPGTDTRFDWLDAGYATEPEEMWAEYYLMFPAGFEAVDGGGKLPGPAGMYGGGGSGGNPVDGTNSWSARATFGPIENTTADMYTPGSADPATVGIRLKYYVYHMDMSGNYGEGFGGWSGTYERERWYRINQYVKMNTSGEADGVLKAAVDGNVVFSKTDLRMRAAGYDHIKISWFWFNIYYGGGWTSPADNHYLFDDVKISREVPLLGTDDL